MFARLLQHVFLACLILGVGLSAVEDGRAQVTCDNKCRERFQFRSCTAPFNCYQLDKADCLPCAPQGGSCKVETYDGTGTCGATEQTTIVYYWSECADVCDCMPAHILQIQALTGGSITTTLTVPRHRCD